MSTTSHKYIINTLAGKLIIAIGLLILIGGGISWYLLLDTAKKNLISDTIKYTASYSKLIKAGTRYSMLTFNREPIQQTIDSIGSTEYIKQVRVFDSKGKIFYSSHHEEIGRMVDWSAPSCIGCHLDPRKPSLTLKAENQWVIYTGKGGYRVLTFIEPIFNEPACYTASCHLHPPEQKVLGILETDFSLSAVDENIRRQTIWISLYAVVFMGISFIVLYFVLQRFVLKPIFTLSNAMEKVSEGDLTQTTMIHSKDEMGLLSNTFNAMTGELHAARKKLEKWSQSLQDEITKKTTELRNSQDKLIQAEKLASLGRLTSDVAHEIRNPLTSIGGFARRLNKIASTPKEKEYAEVVVSEVDRLEKVLRDVLLFSRDARCHLEQHHISSIIQDTLRMYEDICNEQAVQILVEEEKNLPSVLIDLDQVIQSLSNLVSNAIDSMPGGGILKITAGREDLHNVTYVFIKVSDTGKGVPEDKLPFIFEPFYSTKETGLGTGLGLSITRKILEEHGGFIKAESNIGEGSTFSLYFPYQSMEESQKTNCWEFMNCGREKDASIKCPAYPNFGRMCWAVAGTFCEGKVQGTFAQKNEDCRKCKFYQRSVNKES